MNLPNGNLLLNIVAIGCGSSTDSVGGSPAAIERVELGGGAQIVEVAIDAAGEAAGKCWTAGGGKDGIFSSLELFLCSFL